MSFETSSLRTLWLLEKQLLDLIELAESSDQNGKICAANLPESWRDSASYSAPIAAIHLKNRFIKLFEKSTVLDSVQMLLRSINLDQLYQIEIFSRDPRLIAHVITKSGPISFV